MLSTLERVLFLKSMELFEHIHGEDLVGLAQIAQEVRFIPDETLMKQDELGDSLYFIINGEARIIVDDEIEIATLGSESVIGEMSILSSSRRSASAIAVTEIFALKIERQGFQEILSAKPEISLGIINVLVHRLADANHKVGH